MSSKWVPDPAWYVPGGRWVYYREGRAIGRVCVFPSDPRGVRISAMGWGPEPGQVSFEVEVPGRDMRTAARIVEEKCR